MKVGIWLQHNSNETPRIWHTTSLSSAASAALRERYGVRFMGVFGSYVRGEQRRGSDLDLLVESLKPTIGRHIRAEVVPL